MGMRKRLIDPAFFRDEKVMSLNPIDRLLFIALWCMCDRDGLLEDKPFEIWQQFGTFDLKTKEEVDMVLQNIHNTGLIIRYEYEDCKCICIKHFNKFQSPHPHEAKSKLKHPMSLNVITCNDISSNVIKCHEMSCGNGNSVTVNGNGNLESSLRSDSCPEPKDDSVLDTHATTQVNCKVLNIIKQQTQQEVLPASDKTEPLSKDKVILTFPTNGKIKSWECKQSFISDVEKVYPDMDVITETQKALLWIKSNPSKRKTSVGMTRFLNQWYARSNDVGKYARRERINPDDGDTNPWKFK